MSKHTYNLRCGRTVRSGLTMVEAMISLTIAAMVLTAVGVAFTSTARAMQINDQFFRAAQAARVSMTRILAQVRNGSVDDASTANNLHLITNEVKDANGNTIKPALDVTYKLVNETNPELGPKRLLMVIDAGKTTEKTYELARNVTTAVTTTAPFSYEAGTDYNNAACVARVAVTLTVKNGNNEVRLSGSGAPRRNLTY
jgi:type II secretory pathway component PulJ